MPRPTRNDIAGQYYHVVARGNQKQRLFHQEQDYRHYLDLLKAGSLEHGLDTFHYVLMPNHVHLLVRPRQNGSLGRTFHWAQRKYAYWFHRRHNSDGAVWQGRYWNSLIDEENYLLACARYIELNPVRAGLTHNPSDFPWSSAKVYLDGIEDPWVKPSPAWLSLGNDNSLRAARYREFLLAPKERGPGITDEWAFWNRKRIGNQVVPG